MFYIRSQNDKIEQIPELKFSSFRQFSFAKPSYILKHNTCVLDSPSGRDISFLDAYIVAPPVPENTRLIYYKVI